MKILQIILILFIIGSFISCNNEEKSNIIKEDSSVTKNETTVKIKNIINLNVSKPDNKSYTIGDKINISFSIDNHETTDSVNIFVNDKKIVTLTNKDTIYTWNTKQSKVGSNEISVSINKNGNLHRKSSSIFLLSDIIPENYTYKVKNVFKHDDEAYTQGLFYKNGFLYEATGLKGQSTVRKVKLETGEVVQSFAISKDVFGEGIDFYDNKIIQISWEAGKGYVYDFETFKIIDEFSYSGQGWGIASDGKSLFMSNGSTKIQILETQSYSVIDEIEVCDNKQSVRYLNELEYIDGYLYANIYQYNNIAKIDPATGKIVAYINLKEILPMKDYNTKTDVLNGIAYDKEKKRFFVTGKNWPKLFEIELVKK